jgi:AcrR family transcriptional regulator
MGDERHARDTESAAAGGAEPDPRARGRYHHGDLKTALIEAATRLVCERRVEDFSVADAARAVGVSSGAPYRHFADRHDLLDHVAAAGFAELGARDRAAWAAHPPDSIEGLVAAGCAYIAFGAERPELFHLMWGATRPDAGVGAAATAGHACYSGFLSSLAGVLRAQDIGDLDVEAVAQPLWALVHGYAALLIAGNPKFDARGVEHIRPRLDRATRAYLAGLGASAAGA